MPFREGQLGSVFDESEINTDLKSAYIDISKALSVIKVNSKTVDVVKRASLFAEWVEDGRPVYGNVGGSPDKFSELIKLSRFFPETADFFINEVGVNATTVWRWATNNARPSKYLAKALILDLTKLIIKQVNIDTQYLNSAALQSGVSSG